MDFNYIVIEGNIGAGKTSLATKLAKETNSKLILEQFAENPFLPKFYKEPERYAFPVELTFLADRYQQLKNEINPRDLFQSKTISDYYFVKSLIFSRKTLKDDEYSLYKRLFDIIQQQLTKPDIYVYLHVTPDRLLKNIRMRGRSYEIDISLEYLEQIQKSYFEFIKSYPEMTFLVIDVNNLDFIRNTDDYLKLKSVILGQKYEPGMNMVIL
ncbi:MAG: deoxynucleoside kinase [Bacteroidales bacterium]|nr:deoxynucleoside kinase [Bacteroidales bacterium]